MTARTRTILTIVVLLIAALLVFMFMIRPRQAELAEVKEEIEVEESRTAQLQAELRRLQELQENAPRLLAELSEIRGFVPPNHQVPNFIFLVQAAANAAGVDFVQITPTLPEAPLEGAAVAQVRVALGASGGYFAVQDFIRRLYNLDRAARIDQLTLAPQGETLPIVLTMEAQGRIFFEVPVVPVDSTGEAAETTEETDETEDAEETEEEA